MAQKVLTNAYVVLNSVNLSDHVKQVTLDYKAELQDSTAMGDTTRERLGGLKDWTLTIEFFQDYAASNVEATLFPLVGTTFAVEVRADAGAVSTSNPKYTGTGILEGLPLVSGSVGDMAMASVTINAAGALTRATA